LWEAARSGWFVGDFTDGEEALHVVAGRADRRAVSNSSTLCRQPAQISPRAPARSVRIGNVHVNFVKDAVLETAGVLLVEIAEMDALTKATPSAIKSFLSRRRDRFRPPYGKHTINLPRQCVFAATINPTMGGYLKDVTGSRRFWPVNCRGMIDCEGLELVRDQLWAEAVTLFRAGTCWWLETSELEALATTEQTARFVVDAWEEPIREWLADRIDTSVWEVLEHALGLGPKHWTQSAQKRVVDILTRMGFAKRRPRTLEGRKQRYQRDPTPVKKV
jgi:predicted P-loop ATPase